MGRPTSIIQDVDDYSDDEALLELTQTDPVWWVEDTLQAHFWSKQKEIIESVRDNPRTTVRSCNGIGKSFSAGNIALWFLYAFPYSIVITTAPTGRQVEKLIWKEIRTAYSKATIPLGGELLPKSPELQIVQERWYMTGFATNSDVRFQGYHEEDILIIVDESSGVNTEIFEAIEGILTSEHARLLLLGNPNDAAGYFYDSHRQAGWNKIHISAFDTPNFTAFGITPDDVKDKTWQDKIGGRPLPNPKLITPAWVADKYIRWGETSPAYQCRCLGNFPAEGGDQLIPLTWIELAIERWRELEDLPDKGETGGIRQIGADIAWYGDDKTVLAPRIGLKVLKLYKYAKQNTVETTGQIIRLSDEIEPEMIKIDVGGIGGGVYDQVQDAHYPAVPINFGETAMEPEKYADRRAEMYWTVRELLDPDIRNNPTPIALPPDEDMIGDLSCVKYKVDGHGRIRVESKDDIKKRIGHSPDDGDAVVLAFAPAKGRPQAVPVITIDGNSTWRSR